MNKPLAERIQTTDLDQVAEQRMLADSPVLNIDVNPNAEYNSMFIPGYGAAKAGFGAIRMVRRHKLAAAGVALSAFASLGAFIDNGMQFDPVLKNGTMSADVKQYEILGDITAGRATFADKAGAPMQVKVAINKVAFIGDKVAPDFESNLQSRCTGEFEVIIPHGSYTHDEIGEKRSYDVDMSKLYINAYRKEPCNIDRDDDDEKVVYHNLGLLRDSLVKFTPLDSESVPKPDEILADIDDNAAATLSNKSLAAVIDVCGQDPKIMGLITDSVKEGLSRVVSEVSGVDEDNIKVSVHNEDKINWHPKDEVVHDIQLDYAKIEPHIDDKNFKFVKKSCKTTQMVTIGKVKK